VNPAVAAQLDCIVTVTLARTVPPASVVKTVITAVCGSAIIAAPGWRLLPPDQL
jgi:hypothetical protein